MDKSDTNKGLVFHYFIIFVDLDKWKKYKITENIKVEKWEGDV